MAEPACIENLGRNPNKKITVYDTIYFKFFYIDVIDSGSPIVRTGHCGSQSGLDRTRSYQVIPGQTGSSFLDLLRYKILSYIFYNFQYLKEPIKMLNRKR